MTEALPLTETSEEDQVAKIAAFGFDKPEVATPSMLLASLMLLGHLAEAPTLSAPVSAPMRSSAEWAARKELFVLSVNGWDTSTPAAFDASWGRQITEVDFDARAARSVTRPRAETALAPQAATWKIHA